MIGGKMIGHRPISTSQHHPGAQRRQLRTGAIEAEQGQRGHGGRKPGKGMNLATSPQNECENRRRRPSRGLAHTPGTPIFALFRWTSERAASIRCPDGGSGQGSFASFLKGPLPPSGHRIERGTIDLQSDINCLPERSLLGAFGKQHDDYDHDVFNSAGSTLATPHFGPENGVHLSFTERLRITLDAVERLLVDPAPILKEVTLSLKEVGVAEVEFAEPDEDARHELGGLASNISLQHRERISELLNRLRSDITDVG